MSYFSDIYFPQLNNFAHNDIFQNIEQVWDPLKDLNKIIYSQKIATENVFKRKKIPFRSFEIFNRDEKTLGELFTFFILETILLGRALEVNPFDQPSVELIKKETRRILIKN